MFEKKLGYSYGIHGFGAGGENYPLTKAMVDHNHDRIKTVDQREIGNEVGRKVLKGVRALKGKESDGQDHRMGENLVCLANCTPGNIFPDIGGEARPPGHGGLVLGYRDEFCNRVIHCQRSSLQLLTC